MTALCGCAAQTPKTPLAAKASPQNAAPQTPKQQVDELLADNSRPMTTDERRKVSRYVDSLISDHRRKQQLNRKP